MLSAPDFTFELSALQSGHTLICGIDEAGRGPWAGPVVASAVILDQNNIPDGLNDSKKLTHEKREALFDPIVNSSHVGIGIVSAAEIDEINILQATYLAMKRAVENLKSQPTLAAFFVLAGLSATGPALSADRSSLPPGELRQRGYRRG